MTPARARSYVIAALLFAAACTGNDNFEGGSGLPPAPDDGGVATAPESLEPSVVELGEVATGSEVSFDVPTGALGFNILAEGTVAEYDPAAPYGIERITAPNGTVVHDDFRPKGGTNETSVAVFDTIALASVPQGEDVPEALAGKWKVRFGIFGGSARTSKLKAKVRIQSSSDGAFHGGKLDLHVHVPTGLRIGAKTVTDPANDAAIKERVDTLFEYTSELLGIERGEVVVTSESASFRELDGEQALIDGFAISKSNEDGAQRLHVLLTNLIAIDGEPIAAGIAPGIPGAPLVFGRGVSGIIITTSTSATHDALTMLHEAGHFFGLNHTTELDGKGSDPLRDTPECSNLTIDNTAAFLDCPDRTNVMFVAGAIAAPVSLSTSQKRVYQGSPVYRAALGGPIKTTTASLSALAIRSFRLSGNSQLSPVERELSAGFCGLTKLDASALVRHYGRAAAIAQLTAASKDADLEPFIRGRARLALKALGAPAPSAP